MADYYSDSNTSGDETSADTPAQDNETTEQDSPEKESEENETFLVSNDALGGKTPQPGDICKFKCLKNYDSESEFIYMPHDENKNDSSDNEDMQKSNSELDSMAT